VTCAAHALQERRDGGACRGEPRCARPSCAC
jgi:hypothetical protein